MDASLYMRFHIARRNCLFAEDTIREVYSKRRTLTLDVINGIGGAYLSKIVGRRAESSAVRASRTL